MSRILLALVLVAGLSAAANAAVVEFSFDGVPVSQLPSPIEVRASEYHVIDIYIDPEGDAYDSWDVEIIATGEWDPLAGLTVADVSWLPPWVDNALVLDYAPYYDLGSFTTGDPVGTAGPVAEFEIHIPDLAESTMLNLEFVSEWVLLSNAGIALPVTVGGMLELHITPEPATLGLLVLGGLAALRRRFA